MARISVQSIAERGRAELVNVAYDKNNFLFLTPDNIFAEDGDPRRIDVALPDSEDGINVYGGTSPQTLVRQNDSPIPFSHSSWQWSEFTDDGAPSPDTSTTTDTTIGTPGAPTLKPVPSSGQGYNAGTPTVSYSGIDANGNSTLLSPGTPVTITAGQVIQVTMPAIPATWSAINFWMTQPGSSSSTSWFQLQIDLSLSQPSSIRLNGPFKKNTIAPTSNRTYNGAPDRPDTSQVSASYTLKAGTYTIYAVEVTVAGDTPPSSATTVTVTADAQKTIQVSPPNLSSDAIGWRCFVVQHDGRTYAAFPANGNPEQPLATTAKAHIYALDPGEWPQDSVGNPVDYQVAQRDLPIQDNSGLADPIDPLDSPAAITATGVNTSGSAATYYVAIALQINGLEGPRGSATPQLLSPARSIRVIFPKNVQKIANASQTEQDSSNNQLDYTIGSANGTVTPGDGNTRLFVSTGNAGASTKPFIETSPVVINRSEDYSVHGTVLVDTYSSGTPTVFIREYSDASASTFILGTAVAFETGNTTITGNGQEEFDKKILSTDNFWNASTVTATVRVGYVPSSASFGQTISDLEFLEQAHRPEKAKKGKRRKQEADNPDSSPTDTIPEGADYSPRKPKKKGKQQPNRAKILQDRPVTFGTTQNTYTFDTGTSLSGLALVQSPTSNTSQSIGSGFAIDTGTGAQGWHTADTNTTVTAQVYYYQDLGGGLVSLGVRALVRVVTMPTSTFQADILSIMGPGGQLMGTVRLGNGTFTQCVFDASNTLVDTHTFRSDVTNGSIWQLELASQGGNTSDGHLRTWCGVGTGGTPYVAADYDGVDWTGRNTQRYGFGIINETTVNTAPALDFDTVVQTRSGINYVRERDISGNVIYQGIFTLPKKHKVEQNIFPHQLSIPVKPNQSYTLGMFMRTSALKGNQQPFFATLHMEDNSIIELGSIVGQDVSASITGTTPWREYLKTFTTPDKCFELRFNGHNIGPGKYVFQEICLSEGDVTDAAFSVDVSTNILTSTGHGLASGQLVMVYSTNLLPAPLDQFTYYWVVNATTNTLQLSTLPDGAAIDLTSVGSGIQWLIRTMPKRTGLRAASGYFRQTIDTYTPLIGSFAPNIPRTWLSADAPLARQDPGTSYSVGFRGSGDLSNYYPGVATTDLASVPEGRYLEVRGTLTGDGIGTPVVANGAPYLSQELAVATLLREDGSEFDGGTILLDLQAAANLTPVDVRELLNRHIVRFILAAPVGSTTGFKVQCFTESARKEIMQTWMTNNFVVEGRGRSIKIKPKQQIVLAQQPHAQSRQIIGDQPIQFVFSTGEANECEVLEDVSIT